MPGVLGGLAGWRVRRGPAAVAAAAIMIGGLAAPQAAGAAVVTVRPATGWGTAEEIPGFATLNQGDGEIEHSLSCASAGNCSVGGYYTDAEGHDQVFADTETGGTWGTAQEIPGLATLNKRNAGMYTLSCGSAGNCSAGGYYTDSLNREQSFVARQKDGTWQTAKEVPGTATLNADGNSELSAVSCAGVSACSGGGYYVDASNDQQGYVDSETSGSWGKAEEVPGLAALNTDGGAAVVSVSCTSAGNCAAGGYYFTSSGDEEPFVVSQSGGTWGSAQEVPGIGALNTGPAGQAPLESLSCGSAGNCAASGSYIDSAGNVQAWLASEVGGTWGDAEEAPGTAALNTDGFAVADTVSCGSAGNCSAGGWYTGTHIEGFVITQTGGTWGTARPVPGLAALNTSGDAQLWSMSCASAGNCSAGGYYFNDTQGGQEAFVVSQSKGTWGQAKEVPGSESLNVNGTATTEMVSCATAGHCAAAGVYGNSPTTGDLEAFVDNQT